MKNTAIVTTLLVLCMLVSFLICPTVSASTQQAQATKYIAFRNDDIRPGMSLDGLKAVNQVHIDENVPVTLGIIPHPRESEEGNQLLQDGQFLTYMQSIASNPLFEFAQHGYSHTRNQLSAKPSEFIGRSYDDQYNRILKGQADIQEAFGMTPKTFIPPWDNDDSNTYLAAAALGFIEYSGGSISSVHHGYVNGMQTEGSIEIGAVNETAFSANIQNTQKVTERFLADSQSDDTLTITYHTSTFTNSNGSVDYHRVQQLTDFIGFLKAEGVLFTRLDRSSVSAGASADVSGGVLSPSVSTGLAPVASKASNPSVFLLIGSVGIVLSGIFVSARRQGKQNQKNR